MFAKSTAWTEEDERFAHTRHMVELCPPGLVPTVRQNLASGGVSIDWPDVCHCPVNGGPTFEVHELQLDCIDGSDVSLPFHELAGWGCNCPLATDGQPLVAAWLGHGRIEGSAHVAGCPFDDCPLGTCHPMCSQVTGDGQQTWCHCACHG